MFAVIYIPNFSLQAVLRGDPAGDAPVAMVDGESSKPLVIEVNSSALAAGVETGLTANQAMARCGNLRLKSRSDPCETSATEILMQVAYHFSANIEATARGTCTLELKGLSLEAETAQRAWGIKILDSLATFQLAGQMGFARTTELALLAAQVAQPILVVQNLTEFISVLPLSVLAPPLAIGNILDLWGIETVGAFIALGRDAVAERLGEEGLELFNSVLTDSARPLKLVTPPEFFTEQIEFENEVETLDPLIVVLRRFLLQLTRRLTVIHLVTGELILEFGLASGEKIQRVFKVPAPTNDVEILCRTLRTYLETLQTTAPIVFLSLAIRATQLQGHQFGLFETTLRNPNQFSETAARLAALCGAGRVGVPVIEPTHKPDSFRIEMPRFDATTPGRKIRWETNQTALRRFRPVVPAVLDFREQKPIFIRSQLLAGNITNTRGPFVSSGQWWNLDRWGREEWDIQTVAGVHLRVFRSTDGDFIEGIYD
jgi:protein ImuB